MPDERTHFTFLKLVLLLTLIVGCNTPPKQVGNGQSAKASPILGEGSKSSVGQSEFGIIGLSQTPIEVTATWGLMTGEKIDTLRASEIYGHLVRDVKVNTPKQKYSSSDFEWLLWTDPVTVGQTWPIQFREAQAVLSQFLPEATTELNINGSGAYGVLRAASPEYFEVLFRLHAQFPVGDFIHLTPSQFDGRLLIERNSRKILQLTFEVPRNQDKNLAFEVHAYDSISGVGVIEEMKLEWQSAQVATPNWSEEITVEESRTRLADEFYACRKIKWTPINQAFQESQEQGKPLFVLAIAGALDDQSC